MLCRAQALRKNLFAVGGDLFEPGKVQVTWSPRGNLFAAVGQSNKVFIFDRTGAMNCDVALPAANGNPVVAGCETAAAAIAWDRSGDRLAIAAASTGDVVLWNRGTKAVTYADLPFSGCCSLAWDEDSALLFIGTLQGNFALYDDADGTANSLTGVHTGRITAACWAGRGAFACASEDRSVSVVSAATGETALTLPVADGRPTALRFTYRKDVETGIMSQGWLSVDVDHKSLLLLNLSDPETPPLSLKYDSNHGSIAAHEWHGNGYLVVAFSSGKVVLQSSMAREAGTEISSEDVVFGLSSMTCCPALGRGAVAGGSEVRILEFGSELREVPADAITLPSGVKAHGVCWSPDGQVLAVATQDGRVMCFLASLPPVSAAFASHAAFLSSLSEASVLDVRMGRQAPVRTLPLATEPSLLAIGPRHLCAALNNKLWCYSTAGLGATLPGGRAPVPVPVVRDYVGTIDALACNDVWCAALMDGRVYLHRLDAAGGEDDGDAEVILPPRGKDPDVTCVGMSGDFITYGTARGSVCYFMLETGVSVGEYRHGCGVAQVHPSPGGSRCVVQDVQGRVFLHCPLDDTVLPVPDRETSPVQRAVWDVTDPNVFVVCDSRGATAYLYLPVSVDGAAIRPLVHVALPPSYSPMAMMNGVLACHVRSGSVEHVVLPTHQHLQDVDGSKTGLQARLKALITLGRLQEGWDAAVKLNEEPSWDDLANAALVHLDLPLAMECYRELGDPGQVIAYEALRWCEDRSLLAGHVVLSTLRDYDLAEKHFLESAYPTAALEMRQDLRHWDRALALAEELAPDNIAGFCFEAGRMEEMKLEFDVALQKYARAREILDESGDGREPPLTGGLSLYAKCLHGIARCSIHLGEIQAGKRICLDLRDAALSRECAGILEENKMYSDAAALYLEADLPEKAVLIYLRAKNYNAAQPHMSKITSAKLQLNYAKARENESKFHEALKAYQAADDSDSVVRLYLEKLNDPGKAFTIVRRTRSVEGAIRAAKYCKTWGDPNAAKHEVEFHVLAKNFDDALQVAVREDDVEGFLEQAGDAVPDRIMARVAHHFKEVQRLPEAARAYARAGDAQMALQLFLRAGEEYIEEAIDVAGTSPELSSQMLDVLTGETGGKRWPAKYLYKLQMAQGMVEEAAETSLEWARQEQQDGQYKKAHELLLETLRDTVRRGKKPAVELTSSLMVLHSYMLARLLVRQEEHVGAARLLVRVARNLSRFPAHTVPILTSVVVECQRAGLKQTAFEYAAVLLRSEHRSQIAPQYKRKIEGILRKPDKTAEEAAEELVPCAYCGTPGPEMELDCLHCRAYIPFCIASGKRVLLDDWGECPHCRLPCRVREMRQVVSATHECPMCAGKLEINHVHRLEDPLGKKVEREREDQAIGLAV
ncbi:unnamed protein product [Pedinophyceae sp. YPF-701]|nr:unnamed protein product [Pedinophyceae sp. YPF-701]